MTAPRELRKYRRCYFGLCHRVAQEDTMGCGIAVLATITGRPYIAVRDEIESWDETLTYDWDKSGITHYTIDRYLATDGWFTQRRFDTYAELPIEPFADIHYATVVQPSDSHHFVTVLFGGEVLDPAREGEFRLSDWSKVNQLVGLVRP